MRKDNWPTLAARICRRLEEQEDLQLEDLAAEFGYSPGHLQRRFKQTLGLSPKQYQLARRRQRFAQSLPASASVTDAIYQAGYSSSSRAYAGATAELGMSARQRRRGGAGEEIRYVLLESSLGHVLLAATAQGVCFVALQDRPDDLLPQLRQMFPQATLRPDAADLAPFAHALLTAIDQGAPVTDLPLDLRGTAFQLRVWQALRQIPPGQTRSYGELARALGQPAASRAVARACATNPVAVIVPCHRVIGSDGSLRGYRWGMERKRQLLLRERTETSD